MSEKYTIEKGIPVPKKRKYPFDKMEVGDSFLIKHDGTTNFRTAIGGHITAHVRRNPGTKFTSRNTDDGDVRVWRLK